MPEVAGTVLAQRNAHPRDSRITFKEEGHVYTVDGHAGQYISVTTLIHKFFPHFDGDKVISKIIANPRSPYFGMTPEAVNKQWETATVLGSDLHQQIELFFDQIADFRDVPELAAQSIEFGFFLDFFRDHVVGKMKPFRSEWYVFSEDIKVCGSIDMLFCSPNNHDEIYIVDWKRSKEIRTSNRFEKGLRMLAHLDNCNYNTYSLQLNMYKYILETKYNKIVKKMMLVVLHPNHDRYKVIQVPNMDAEIHAILLAKDQDKENMPAFKGNVKKYL